MTKSKKRTLYKSIFATFLFILFTLFYNREIVRSQVEDIAFDTINNYFIYKQKQNVSSPKIIVLSFDDFYMKSKNLFDEDNKTNYGYGLPRDNVAEVIKNLDKLVDRKKVSPKALFIDYDIAFSTMPYGKELSKEDKEFLNILSKKHKYKIFLAKTSKYNIVESSKNSNIKQAIKDNNISIVSVNLLQSNDDAVRRYEAWSSFGIKHPTKPYINIDIALWCLSNGYTYSFIEDDNDYKLIVKQNNNSKIISKDDIINNRILLKDYNNTTTIKELNCQIKDSYWKPLTQYSANCLNGLSDINNSVILLGSTHSQNPDIFKTLNVFNSKIIYGINMHANILMTLFYFDGQLKLLPIYISSIIVFFTFFLIDILVVKIFKIFKFKNIEILWMVVLALNAMTLLLFSYYFLIKYHLWFNWFIPIILFYLLDVILIIQTKSPILFVWLMKAMRKSK